MNPPSESTFVHKLAVADLTRRLRAAGSGGGGAAGGDGPGPDAASILSPGSSAFLAGGGGGTEAGGGGAGAGAVGITLTVDVVRRLRADLQRQHEASEAQLQAAVQTQLDELQRSVDLLARAQRDMARARDNFRHIDGTCAGVTAQIANFREIKLLKTARDNLGQTLEMVKFYHDVPARVERLREALRTRGGGAGGGVALGGDADASPVPSSATFRQVYTEWRKLELCRDQMLRDVKAKLEHLREVDTFAYEAQQGAPRPVGTAAGGGGGAAGRHGREQSSARLATISAVLARQDFAEHFHTLECGHRPSQALNSADRISAPL